jgi:RNA polymerase sigma-70 factor (ECF subfamily)
MSEAPPLSRAEIDNAIKLLTAVEKTKIMKIAAQYAPMTPYGDKDLFQEACLRAMDGRRKWPRALLATTFFWQVMRSIAWEWKRKGDDPLDEDIGDKGAGERTLLNRIYAMEIIKAFDDDPIAQNILVARMKGARGEELRKLSGLSPKDYESKIKNIRRRIEKLLAEKK